MTPTGAARRFVLLAGLRWLPTGLVVPVMVLLAASRGLTPSQIALVFTLQGAVVVVLELPTGGLADALGRRAVLVAGGLLHEPARVSGMTSLIRGGLETTQCVGILQTPRGRGRSCRRRG